MPNMFHHMMQKQVTTNKFITTEYCQCILGPLHYYMIMHI